MLKQVLAPLPGKCLPFASYTKQAEAEAEAEADIRAARDRCLVLFPMVSLSKSFINLYRFKRAKREIHFRRIEKSE